MSDDIRRYGIEIIKTQYVFIEIEAEHDEDAKQVARKKIDSFLEDEWETTIEVDIMWEEFLDE